MVRHTTLNTSRKARDKRVTLMHLIADTHISEYKNCLFIIHFIERKNFYCFTSYPKLEVQTEVFMD